MRLALPQLILWIPFSRVLDELESLQARDIRENEHEISSSSLSFASLPAVAANAQDPDCESTLDYLNLSKLSSSLKKLLLDPGFGYTDADIVVDRVAVGVHRCLLAARSDYFHGLFSKPCDDSSIAGCAAEEKNLGNGSNKRPRYHLPDLRGFVGLEAFNVVLNYLYTGSLKQSLPEVLTCIDGRCPHDACRPAVDYAVELMYASMTFQIEELVLLLQRRLLYFVDKALVEDVIPILVAGFRCNSKQLLSHCIQRISLSNLDPVTLEKVIPSEVLSEIKLLRNRPSQGLGLALHQSELTDHGKRVSRTHRALDSIYAQWELKADDLHMLEYLESRVKMAGIVFPYEAKIAMEIAGADWTPVCKGLAPKGSPATVNNSGSNKAASMSAEQLQQKLQALRKTVEIGQHYFPRCSEVIVRFIDDMPDAFYLEKGSEEEQKFKKMRFMELRDDVQRAFHKDIAGNSVPTSIPSDIAGNSVPTSIPSSSSSSSPRDRSRTRKGFRVGKLHRWYKKFWKCSK